MQFTVTINQAKALEWGLNAQQAMLFAFVYECPSWCRPVTKPEGVFYALGKAKITEELPLLTDKPDTAYRLLRQLAEAGVIELSHTPSITLVRLTDKGRTWNHKRDGSEKYPTHVEGPEEGRKKIRAGSEKNPSRVGKKSEPRSEKNPTNQDTSNQGTNQGERDRAPIEMTIGWKPDPDALKARATYAGLSMSLFSPEAIATYVLHHEAKGLLKTEAEWVAGLILWVKRDAAQAAASAARPAPPSRREDVDFDTYGYLSGGV